MNAPILNRAGQLPDDNWYQIEVSGEHLNPTAGVVQVIDEAARQSIVNRFAALAAAAGDDFAGLLVDRDHFSLDPDKSSESLGWLKEVRNRAGQLEGRIEWTPVGEPLVRGKVFKFFSTVYARDAVEAVGTRQVKNRSVPAVRPLALDRLALTNDPNNRGGKPISNRTGASAGEETHQTQVTSMHAINKALGLAEDAPEASALAELQKIQNRATQAEAQVATLKTERDALLAAQVEADLTKYEKVIKNRDAVKAALLANRADTILLLEALQAPAPATTERITNRSAAQPPAGASEDAAEKERARGAKIANRAAELRAANPRLSRAAAFAKAETEIGS